MTIETPILLERLEVASCSVRHGASETRSTGDRAVDIPAHLAGPLQDYFTLLGQGPLPERLTELMRRFEARLAIAGECTGDRFRADLINALSALRTFALSLCGNPTRADDLVQEAMLKAWANQEKFVRGTNFTAWIFTILRNQFYSECRKARREVEDAEGRHAETLTVPADQEDVAALGSIMNLIGTLPNSQRQALLLVGAQGFTYEEAAAQLGCQVGTVKSRVSRARTSLVFSIEQQPIMLDFFFHRSPNLNRN